MPDAELLVFRVLDRPPRVGELYYYPKAPEPSNTRVYRLQQGHEAAESVASMRAVVPVEDYLSGAVERVVTLMERWGFDGHDIQWEARARELRLNLLPPPPEPDVPEWARNAADDWYARDTNLDEVQLARHIAKCARAAEGK